MIWELPTVNIRGSVREYWIEEEPRAIINPFKEKTRQNGRRIKEPNEPMFTLTVTDRHGIVHRGRIRRLMPLECWRLQAFTDDNSVRFRIQECQMHSCTS